MSPLSHMSRYYLITEIMGNKSNRDVDKVGSLISLKSASMGLVRRFSARDLLDWVGFSSPT